MYYNHSTSSVLHDLNTSMDGLREEEAQKRIKENGKNIIITQKKANPIIVFLSQFKDILVIILIICVIISFIVKDFESSIVIVIVLLLNAILGTIQYFKAQASLETLKNIRSKEVIVLRNKKEQMIDARDLCVGDIVIIRAGDIVPADGRIIISNGLEVDESQITGESIPVLKSNELIKGEVAINEQKNMLFSGCSVLKGDGLFVVCNIGNQTIIGNIAKMINKAADKETPLQKNLNRLSLSLAIIITMICAVIFFITVKRGSSPLDSLIFSLALAVAAIPEALSSVVSITLSIGSIRLANKGAIVKDLKSVEALGSISVICCDKTGTITENKMRVESFFSNRGTVELNDELIKCLIYCNTSSNSVGNETEKAINKFLESKGIDYLALRNEKKIEVIPFDSKRKMMIVNVDGKSYYKGAIDYLIDDFTHYYNYGIVRFTTNYRFEILASADEMANKGLRVIGCGLTCDNKNIFLGLIGLIDLPRNMVLEAINKCHLAGINVMMISGDSLNTAFSIAKMVNITKNMNECFIAKTIDELTDDELDQKIMDIKVIARATPEDKTRLVSSLERRGQIVGMTGDGINDAPALREANIGFAMGLSGTDVAKEAANIILTEDNFTNITDAIFLGRVIYANISNAILFLLSGNMAGIIAVVVTLIFNLPMPFSAPLLLFINLVTDSIPAIAIGMENYHESAHYPKRGNKIISPRFLLKTAFYGLLLGGVTIWAYYIGFQIDNETAVTNAFLVICIGRLFHCINCMTQGSVLKHGIKNKYVLESILFGLALVIGCMTIPQVRLFLSLSSLSNNAFFKIIFIAMIPTIIVQILKLLKEQFNGYY